jgi:hypothetical protein
VLFSQSFSGATEGSSASILEKTVADPAGGGLSSVRKAAIIDQLSLSQPDQAFVDSATRLLGEAGYAVDYYPGEEVTVGFYRELPTHGYGLIILRVHSGLAKDHGKPTGYVSLFSGEPFSETFHDARTFEDAEAGRLGRAAQFEGGAEYYGIVPAFIQSSMQGTFEGATVILMGCDGLATDSTAEAFLRKGARAVVGWDGRVLGEHTDQATERLLQHLVLDRLSIREAVAQTLAEVGQDPKYQSTLLVYPPQG